MSFLDGIVVVVAHVHCSRCYSMEWYKHGGPWVIKMFTFFFVVYFRTKITEKILTFSASSSSSPDENGKTRRFLFPFKTTGLTLDEEDDEQDRSRLRF